MRTTTGRRIAGRQTPVHPTVHRRTLAPPTRVERTPGTRGHAIWVEGSESVCSGLISGAALIGIGNAILNALAS